MYSTGEFVQRREDDARFCALIRRASYAVCLLCLLLSASALGQAVAGQTLVHHGTEAPQGMRSFIKETTRSTDIARRCLNQTPAIGNANELHCPNYT
eukprot:6019667-Pleurochrysis_carterae.AAC.2